MRLLFYVGKKLCLSRATVAGDSHTVNSLLLKRFSKLYSSNTVSRLTEWMDQPSYPDRSLLTIAPHDHLQGEMDALIILIEYGDYQCPYCAEVYKMIQTTQQRLNHQLCFVFRHFPQKWLHIQAQKAAEATEAAAAQGKFWQMHNILFERQKFLGDGNLLEYANELGLDLYQFLCAIAQHQYANRVAQDIESGKQCGVTRTPTLFINQNRYDDAWEVERLITAILSLS